MMRAGQTVCKGLKEEKTMLMLFGEEIESLSCNSFDGSKEECQIFTDIFYSGSFQDESNSFAVSWASNSHRDGVWGCRRKMHINFNKENSNNSSISSMKDSSGEALQLAKTLNLKDIIRSEYVLKSSGSWTGKLNSWKSSSTSLVIVDKENIQHSCSYPYKNNELVKSDSHGYQPFSFRIVESFAHGILSSYYSVNLLGSMDVTSGNVDCAILNYRSSVQQIGNNNVILEANLVTSPVSQESIASGLVKGRSSIDVKDNSGVAASMDQIALGTLKRHPSGGSTKRVTYREMPDRLESYAHRLLIDVGWIIEPRVRKGRIKLSYFFKKPDEGLARSSLSSAWKTCGERLLYSASESEKDDQGREWSDVNVFWIDLKEVLAYIDLKTQQQENKLSLLRRWQLLDPFLAVVFISRKLSILRMGKSLRAVRSATFIPECGKDICDINMNEDRKRKSKSLSNKSKLTENHSPALNPTDSPIDSPCSSDLESEDLCGGANKMLVEKELQQETTSGIHKSSLCQQESRRSCDESDGFSLKEKLAHGYALSGSTEISLHSECLEPSQCLKRQTGNVLSNSEDESSHTYDGSIPKTSSVKKSRREVFSTKYSLRSGSENSHKISEASKSEDPKGSGLKRSRGFHINDDDLLIVSIFKKKDLGVSCKKFLSKSEFPRSEALRKTNTQMWGCRLLPTSLGSDEKLSTDGKQIPVGTRTVLGWLIDMGVVSLKDVVQFRNPKNHEVIKDGWVTRDGFLCNCCSQVFSVSGFKAHAGLRQNRPPLDLYLKSGKSYTLCQLEAWSAEYKLRKGRLKVMNVVKVDQNDDTCGICADGGELLCCDNCPSTYHQSCLSAQELPEGSWYCASCICKICNNLACKKENSSYLVVFECSQCGHKYHGACIVDKVPYCGDVGSKTWFCGDNCKKVFWGLRSRVGMPTYIEDGLSWTILRSNHDQDVYSPLKIALMAECNSKLAIALTLMEECFLPMVDPTTGIDMVPHVLYNWGSNFARLNYEGFYSIILEKSDVLISVASIRVHGVKVAEMPFIATCGLQRRQGMCRRLMNAIETMLRSFKVEMIVLSAIPSLVETWMGGFGFSVIDAEEKKLLDDINLMLFPGTVMLKKKISDPSFPEAGGNKSQILVDFDGNKHLETGQQSSKDGRPELDVESMVSTFTNLEH